MLPSATLLKEGRGSNHTGVVDANLLNPRNPPDLLAFVETSPDLDADLLSAISAQPALNMALGLTSTMVQQDLHTLRATCVTPSAAQPVKLCGLAALRLPTLPDITRASLQAARDRLRLVYSQLVRIRFENRTSDQSLVVTFTVYEPSDLQSSNLSLIDLQRRIQDRHPSIHVHARAGGLRERPREMWSALVAGTV